MPSDKNTSPTINRMRRTLAGAFAVKSFRKNIDNLHGEMGFDFPGPTALLGNAKSVPPPISPRPIIQIIESTQKARNKHEKRPSHGTRRG